MGRTLYMRVTDNLIGRAASIPTSPAVPITSTSPIVLDVPGRIVPLEIKVTMPSAGTSLPAILLSHGGGNTNYLNSLDGLAPLVEFWAAHGFAVIQPTHLSSQSLKLDRTTPGAPLYWQQRHADFQAVLAQLDLRIDTTRIAAAGHSFGGHTACMLLGLDFTDDDGTYVMMRDQRVRAGVILAATGAGDDHLGPAAKPFASLRTAGFSHMTPPALVIIGDQDDEPALSSRGVAYHADAYSHAPGPKSLLTLRGAGHMLGGITGYDAVETTDENPERVSAIARLSWAYLWSALHPGDPAWANARAAFAKLADLGKIEEKDERP
jgi:acetyl esterase/lipase